MEKRTVGVIAGLLGCLTVCSIIATSAVYANDVKDLQLEAAQLDNSLSLQKLDDTYLNYTVEKKIKSGGRL